MAREYDTTDARQGETSRGMHVLWILVISTGAAIVLAAVAHWWLLATPAEDATGPLPEVSSPNLTPPASLPAQDGSAPAEG